MRTVWVIEKKQENNRWAPSIAMGLYNYENEANRVLHDYIAQVQFAEMKTLPDMRSPKRGQGKLKFETKLREIAHIPSTYRVRQINVR